MDPEELDRLTQAVLEEFLAQELSKEQPSEAPSQAEKERAVEKEEAGEAEAAKIVLDIPVIRPLSKRPRPKKQPETALQKQMERAVKREVRKTPVLSRRPVFGEVIRPPIIKQPMIKQQSQKRQPGEVKPRGPREVKPRPKVQPMDPEVEKRQREKEGLEKEKSEQKKKKRALPQSIPPPVPSIPVARPAAMRPKLVERKAVVAAEPRASQESVLSQIRSLFNTLESSITDMFAIQHLDQREFKAANQPGEVLNYVQTGMLPKLTRYELEDNLKKVFDNPTRETFTRYYDWLKDLAKLHTDWVALQLDILRYMQKQHEGSESLRCHVMENFSNRFANYMNGLYRLFQSVISSDQATTLGLRKPIVTLEKYLALPLGTDRRIREPTDKFRAVWDLIVGRDPQLFSQLLKTDVNCAREDTLPILKNLEHAASYMILLADWVLSQEIQKTMWEERLQQVQDESASIQQEQERQAEPIDYSDLLATLGSSVTLQDVF